MGIPISYGDVPVDVEIRTCPPAFHDDAGFGEGVEDLAIEKLVAEAGVEALDVEIRTCQGTPRFTSYTLTHEKAEKISCLETGVGFDFQYDWCWLSLT